MTVFGDVLCNGSLPVGGTFVCAITLDQRAAARSRPSLYGNEFEQSGIAVLCNGTLPGSGSLVRGSLAINEQQLGAEHPDTAGSLNNLALLYYAMGRYQSAEPLYLRALEIWFNRLGENHPNTQKVWSNFIYCLLGAMSAGQDSQLSQHPTTQSILQQLRERE